MDVNKAIRMAVETGKTEFGARTSLKAALKGKPKLLIIAENCPKETREGAERYAKLSNVPFYVYKGSSLELGSICGKPFSVSILSIFEEGNSNVMDLATQ